MIQTRGAGLEAGLGMDWIQCGGKPRPRHEHSQDQARARPRLRHGMEDGLGLDMDKARRLAWLWP